jgi:hypothetical protein
MKCKVCGEECEGDLTIIENLGNGQGLEIDACEICFYLWTNEEWGKLNARVKR